MADLSDIENALTGFLADCLYPDGKKLIPLFSEGPSPLKNCLIFRGWPVPQKLREDLTAKTAHISVFSGAGNSEILPFFVSEPKIISRPLCLLKAVIDKNSLYLSGEIDRFQLLALKIDGFDLAYRGQDGQTPAVMAEILAQDLKIRGIAVNQTKNCLIFPPDTVLSAKTAVAVTAVQEIRRQKQNVQITLWCPTPKIRDVLSGFIDNSFACHPTLTLKDGAAAKIFYLSTRVSDTAEGSALYQRSLTYKVEYPTLREITLTPFTVPVTRFTPVFSS